MTVERRWAMIRGRAVLRHLLQIGLDGLFRMGVERRGRLVEQQDGRVLEDGPGNRHPLFLAAGQLQPPLADPGVVAVRQPDDEVVDMGHAGRLLDFVFCGFRTAVGDVVEDRVVEQHGVLRNDADRRAHRVLCCVTSRMFPPVDALRLLRIPYRKNGTTGG